MGGFDAAALSDSFALDSRLRPVSVMTIGKLGTPDQLEGTLKERELEPRTRAPREELFIVNE